MDKDKLSKGLLVDSITEIDFDAIMQDCESGFFIARTNGRNSEKLLFVRNSILERFIPRDNFYLAGELVKEGWGWGRLKSESSNLTSCRYMSVDDIDEAELVAEVEKVKVACDSQIRVTITEILGK